MNLTGSFDDTNESDERSVGRPGCRVGRLVAVGELLDACAVGVYHVNLTGSFDDTNESDARSVGRPGCRAAAVGELLDACAVGVHHVNLTGTFRVPTDEGDTRAVGRPDRRIVINVINASEPSKARSVGAHDVDLAFRHTAVPSRPSAVRKVGGPPLTFAFAGLPKRLRLVVAAVEPRAREDDQSW